MAGQNASTINLSNRVALRPEEAADAFGVCIKTLRKWMREEELPFFHMDRLIFIPVAGLEDWIEKRSHAERSSDEIANEILNDF